MGLPLAFAFALSSLLSLLYSSGVISLSPFSVGIV
jgi:hypothetical protein